MAYQLGSYNTLLSILYLLNYVGIIDKNQCKRALLKLKKLENSTNLTEFVQELNNFKSECMKTVKDNK